MSSSTLRYSETDLPLAAAQLRAGRVVAFPTETVYGLGALALDEAAVQRIFLAKGRPSDNPLIVHIAHPEDVISISKNLPPQFWRLAEAFWPGPLTLVVPRASNVPSSVSGGLPTVAVRLPAHPLARELIGLVGEPLVAPSANLSGRPSPTSADHVWDDLAGRIHGILDGGPCLLGVESTVVSLFDPARPTLLRPGSITPEEIEVVLGGRLERAPSAEAALASPGMRYRHYAPNTPLALFFSEEDLELHRMLTPAQRRWILLPPSRLGTDKTYFAGESTIPLTAPVLYSLLRAADQSGIEEVCVLCMGEIAEQSALMDRLLRASGVAAVPLS